MKYYIQFITKYEIGEKKKRTSLALLENKLCKMKRTDANKFQTLNHSIE